VAIAFAIAPKGDPTFRADNVFFKLAGLALLVAFVAALTPQTSFGQNPRYWRPHLTWPW
jgi:hypothetical protein